MTDTVDCRIIYSNTPIQLSIWGLKMISNIQYKSGVFAIGFFCFIGFLLLLRIFFDFTIFPTQIHRGFLHRIILLIGCFCLIFASFLPFSTTFFAFFSYFYSLLAVHIDKIPLRLTRSHFVRLHCCKCGKPASSSNYRLR